MRERWRQRETETHRETDRGRWRRNRKKEEQSAVQISELLLSEDGPLLSVGTWSRGVRAAPQHAVPAFRGRGPASRQPCPLKS